MWDAVATVAVAYAQQRGGQTIGDIGAFGGKDAGAEEGAQARSKQAPWLAMRSMLGDR